VHTTFVRPLQAIAERAVTSHLRAVGHPGLQAALVALNPHTGDVLALVGGRDFRTTPFNRATLSRRQAGSAFKPFVYAAALERGLSPLSVLTGLSRLRVAGPDEWVPQNASGEIRDTTTLRDALVHSDNRAAVALQQQVGSRHVLALASASGLGELPDVPSLALGVGSVSPLSLTAAYAVFPNGGYRITPRVIVRVLDDDTSIVERRDVDRERVLSALSAFQTVTMLQDVLDRGTGTATRALGVRFPAAGKTGTTDDFKDAWLMGFTSGLVVGVWVGFDQPAPIGPDGYGARYALPIWSSFMREAARFVPPDSFAIPEGIHEQRVCRLSKLMASQGCPAYTEYFKHSDATPGSVCPHHPSGHIEVNVDRFLGRLGRQIAGLLGR
jgi:membrane carboxypeptidase/penicillin-binding protein